MTLRNFSCIVDVSNDSLTDEVWTVSVSDDSQSGWNGYVTASVGLVLFMLGTVWNGFVLVTILWKRLLKSPILILMFNLAIANMIVCVMILPFVIISGFAQEFIFGATDSVRCKVCALGMFNIILPFISILILALMAVERFLYLKLPISYSTYVNNKRTIIIVTISWIFSVLMSVPPFFGFGSINFSYVIATCGPLFVGESHLVPNFYYTLFITGTGLVAFIVLIVMYIWILLIARKYIHKHEQRATKSSVDNLNTNESYFNGMNPHDYRKRQVLMMRLFFFIVAANIIIWLPWLLIAIAGAIFGSHRIPAIVYSMAYFSLLSGIVIHPALQTTLIYELRMIFVMVMSKLGMLLMKIQA